MSLMGLWSKLFSESSAPARAPDTPSAPAASPARTPLAPRPPKYRASGERDSRYSEHILSVDSLNFVGQASQSPNKRWVVGSTDRQPGMNSRLDHRDGSVVLLDYQADQVVLRISDLYRPMESAVSDNGAFVVCDGNFGNRLSSDVLAFDATQKKVLNRSYAANVLNLAISKCGRYAVVQTANAPNDDGSVLELFDLQTGKALFSRQPQTGWADEYAFALGDDGLLKKLTVVHKDTGRFSYSPAGEFLDQTAYRKARLFKGSPEMRIYGAKDELKADPTNHDLAEELLASLDTALKELDRARVDYLAIGLRAKGETLELLGRTAEAVNAYEEALAVNPKVGVATRVAKLKKLGMD
jgi:tetratricopeptide (TPR) repeat protein